MIKVIKIGFQSY